MQETGTRRVRGRCWGARGFLASAIAIAAGIVAGCGSSSSSAAHAQSGSEGAHAAISRCYIDSSGLPQAEVTLEDAGTPKIPSFTAIVDFHIVGNPEADEVNSYWVQLEPVGGKAQGTTEVSEPLVGGEATSCALRELRQNFINNSRKLQGEGPEVPLG